MRIFRANLGSRVCFPNWEEYHIVSPRLLLHTTDTLTGDWAIVFITRTRVLLHTGLGWRSSGV